MKLKQAMANLNKAGEELRDTIKVEYPLGEYIEWERRDQLGRKKIHCGYVTMHSYGQRIKVRNRATGSEYWIHCGDIR